MPQTPANGLAIEESKPAEAKSDASDGVTEGVRKLSFSKAEKIHISNHNKIHIMLPSSATHATSGTSGTVTNVRDSVIDMSISAASAFANLTLKNIQGSLIVCGHVDGSVHITGVKDSVLVVATRQFRMHESKNVKVYMLCRSRPIIEDCEGIEFAVMPDCYVSLSLPGLVAQELREPVVLTINIRPQTRTRMSRTCTTKLTISSGSRQNTAQIGAYWTRTNVSKMRIGRMSYQEALGVVSRRFSRQLGYELWSWSNVNKRLIMQHIAAHLARYYFRTIIDA